MTSAPIVVSILASTSGLPCSMVISVPMSLARLRRMSAALRITR